MNEKYIAVSACLLGVNCKYSGGNNYKIKLEEYIRDRIVLVICPEVFGGLEIPRHPSEIIGDKVVSDIGVDVTKEYTRGAEETLRFLKSHHCDTAILKNGSPSCGNYTYDGTFTHTKVDRMGVTAKLLMENGIKLIYID